MIERRRAHDEVNRAAWAGQPFGSAGGKPEPPVSGRQAGRVDHGLGRIDASQLDRPRVLAGQLTQQVPGTAAHVEDTPRRRARRCGERGRPVGDVVVHAAAPALLVTGGSFLEGGEIAARRHSQAWSASLLAVLVVVLFVRGVPVAVVHVVQVIIMLDRLVPAPGLVLVLVVGGVVLAVLAGVRHGHPVPRPGIRTRGYQVISQAAMASPGSVASLCSVPPW